MHEEENGFWWDSQKETDYWEDLDVGGRTILKQILESQDGVMWNGLIGFQGRNQWRTFGVL
jgi:hypothetical protein